MLRVDLHIHVGSVFRGKLPKDIYIDNQDLREYLEDQEITHCCVTYTDRKSLEDLMRMCPRVIFYPIQWIDIETQNFHLDINKGVKFHTHRGRGDLYGKPIVSEYDKLDNMLERFPDNHIIQYHTQGNSSTNNQSRGGLIARNATKFPTLKHMILHAGSFDLRSAYPIKENHSPSPYYNSLIHSAVSCEVLVNEAALIADRLPNVFVDSSILLSRYKADLVVHCKRSGLGSDFPFCKTKAGRIIAGVKNQEMKIKNIYKEGEEIVREMHERSLRWLEEDLPSFDHEFQVSRGKRYSFLSDS